MRRLFSFACIKLAPLGAFFLFAAFLTLGLAIGFEHLVAFLKPLLAECNLCSAFFDVLLEKRGAIWYTNI